MSDAEGNWPIAVAVAQEREQHQGADVPLLGRGTDEPQRAFPVSRVLPSCIDHERC